MQAIWTQFATNLCNILEPTPASFGIHVYSLLKTCESHVSYSNSCIIQQYLATGPGGLTCILLAGNWPFHSWVWIFRSRSWDLCLIDWCKMSPMGPAVSTSYHGYFATLFSMSNFPYQTRKFLFMSLVLITKGLRQFQLY